MDALSHLIATLAPRGRMDLRCLFGEAFAVPHAVVGPWRAPFHIVLQGDCELWLPDSGTLLPLTAGSLLVLPRGAAHVLRHGGGKRPRKLRTQAGALLELKTNLAPGAAAEVDILCGEFEFHGRRRSLLLEALPEHLLVRLDGRPEFGWLHGLVRMMAHEVAQQGPGAASVVADLSGVLFTLALRAHLQDQPHLGGVLALMRSPRLAPALAAMLEQPQQPWTLAALAALCHLSRASFAREFSRAVGHEASETASPMALLTALRMERAAQLLAQGTLDAASAGEAVGYVSEAAFSRAFARHMGQTPGRFRRGAA